MKILFLDVETTGLNARQHGIIQISGILDIRGEVAEEFDFRCKPFKGDDVTKEALKITGTTWNDLRSYPDPKQVYQKILSIFDKYIDRYNKADKFTFAGQNPRFDYDFMNEWFKKNGNGYFYGYVKYHLFDLISATTMFKIAEKIDVPNMKLETVAKHFNIPLDAHNSLNDIRATRELFYKYVALIKQIKMNGHTADESKTTVS